MKVLYITPWSPDPRTGGGRHCYANLRSLCSMPGAIIDYVGPNFDTNLNGINYSHFNIIFSREYNWLDKAHAFLTISATSLCRIFYQFINQYSCLKYDLVFIESSRCGFVFDNINPKTKTICCIHNVEASYLSFNRRGIKKVSAINAKRSEKYTLQSCNSLLAMHDEDIQKICSFYKIDADSLCFHKHPVCSFPPQHPLLPYEERERVIFFSGSLDSKFNEEAISEFVRICWEPLGQSHDWILRIAGRNPSLGLLKYLEKFENIDVRPNPDDMEKLLRKAAVLVLPDLTGTGMKLRVAEALSLGVPVVGTQKGFAGYEPVDNFGFSFDTIGEITPLVQMIVSNKIANLEELSVRARKTWQEKYKFEAFEKRVHGIVSQLLGSDK